MDAGASVHLGFPSDSCLVERVDDSVGTFLCGAKLSLGKVFSCRGDLAQDEVAYV